VSFDLRVERPASIPDFYKEARDYLLEHEAEHGLMVSVASAMLVAPAESYWSVVRTPDGQVVGAALRSMPKMMLSREGAPGAMAAIAEDAHEANFDSIIGPRPSLQSFAAAFGGRWQQLGKRRTPHGLRGTTTPGYFDGDANVMRTCGKAGDRVAIVCTNWY